MIEFALQKSIARWDNEDQRWTVSGGSEAAEGIEDLLNRLVPDIFLAGNPMAVWCPERIYAESILALLRESGFDVTVVRMPELPPQPDGIVH